MLARATAPVVRVRDGKLSGFTRNGVQIFLIGGGSWGGWIFARKTFPAIDSFFPAGLLKDFVAKPFADVTSFDFDRDPGVSSIAGAS
jgi:hypothetical protein